MTNPINLSANIENSCSSQKLAHGLTELTFHFESKQGKTLPDQIKFSWHVPQRDFFNRWDPECHFERGLPWIRQFQEYMTMGLPLIAFQNAASLNRLVIVLSDTKDHIVFGNGVDGYSHEVNGTITIHFAEPRTTFKLKVRIDQRELFFAESIRQAVDFLLNGESVFPVPETAFEPLYSSWYAHCRDLDWKCVESECAEAVKYGCRTLIVDDGWHCEERINFSNVGDWKPGPLFPDFKKHVKRIHTLGMKYMLWIALPFIGIKAENYSRFKNKLLRFNDGYQAGTLDPRFPEVRKYLTGHLEELMKNYDLDGFKLDFLDSFELKEEDPAIKDNFAGRDFKTVQEALLSLLNDLTSRLKAIKKEVLIEFRQAYIGTEMQKYANMLRAGDSPGDAMGNRSRTVQIRLAAYKAAVHSDMIEWDPAASVEAAALQMVNTLFSVPQISVRFSELPQSHKKMLKFYLDFMKEHRKTLLHGTFRPWNPEMNFPLVEAIGDQETITVVYLSGKVIFLPDDGLIHYIFNGTLESEVLIHLNQPIIMELRNTQGEPGETQKISSGIHQIKLSPGGMISVKSFQESFLKNP